MTTVVATGAPAPIRPGSASRRKQQLAPYLFVLPFFVVFVAMLVVPLGYAAWTSLFRSRLIGGKVFAGLDNYTRALTDPGFLEGLRRVALILLVQVPIMLGLALVFALVLDSGRARRVARPTSAHLPAVCGARCRRDPHVGLPLRSRLRPDRPGIPGGRSRGAQLLLRTEHARRDHERRHVVICWLQHGDHVLGPPSHPHMSSTKLPRSTARPSSESPGASRSP